MKKLIAHIKRNGKKHEHNYYKSKGIHGREKRSRLIKRLINEIRNEWIDSGKMYPDELIVFDGCTDAKGRRVWGVENRKAFSKRGKIMVGSNSGVMWQLDDEKPGYDLAYALNIRTYWCDSSPNIKFVSII